MDIIWFLLEEKVPRNIKKECRAIPSHTRDKKSHPWRCFYRTETQGRHLGEPVPNAVSRGTTNRSKTTSTSWLTFSWNCPASTVDNGDHLYTSFPPLQTNNYNSFYLSFLGILSTTLTKTKTKLLGIIQTGFLLAAQRLAFLVIFFPVWI